MSTFFDALLHTARALDAVREGSATGGSATSLTDSLLATQAVNAGAIVGGTVFIVRDAGGLGAAPERDSRPVAAYDDTTGTLTAATAFTAAVAAGDNYAVLSNRYPRGLLLSKLNEALGDLGDIPTEDISLTTAANQREYNLPAAAARDLRQVWLAGAPSAPYRWTPALSVYMEGSAPGTLIFPYQPPAGLKLKLVYLAPHAFAQADADPISDYVSLDWLGLEAATRCARFRLTGPGRDDAQGLPALVSDLAARAERARKRRRPAWPASFPILPAPEDDGRW